MGFYTIQPALNALLQFFFLFSTGHFHIENRRQVAGIQFDRTYKKVRLFQSICTGNIEMISATDKAMITRISKIGLKGSIVMISPFRRFHKNEVQRSCRLFIL